MLKTTKIMLAGVTALLLTTTAHAAEKTISMSIDFVGDWCFQEEGRQGSDMNPNETAYQLPSWSGEFGCEKTKILSITKTGWFDRQHQNENCYPVRIKQIYDPAEHPAFTAQIIARCYSDGRLHNNDKGELKIFKFSRYKGGLNVIWIGYK
jgi:hypothetical protein